MRKLTKYQVFISKYIFGASTRKDYIFWSKQTGIVKRLFGKYPEEFLLNIEAPQFCGDIFCATWFMTEQGKNYLNNQYLQYLKNTKKAESKEAPKLQENKIGEDIIIEKEPRNLKEFLQLKYG